MISCISYTPGTKPTTQGCDLELNLQPFCLGDDAPTNWATLVRALLGWHSCSTFLLIFFSIVLIITKNNMLYHLIFEIVTLYILDYSSRRQGLLSSLSSLFDFFLFIIFPSPLYYQYSKQCQKQNI